jgi:peptide-methionine (S)-S-oxide reductase
VLNRSLRVCVFLAGASAIVLGGLIMGGCSAQEEVGSMHKTSRPRTIASTIGKESESGKTQTAMFGAGCFWGVEATFRGVEGVLSTTVGYSGGTFKNPTYADLCSGRTGHAEVVQVVYDPKKVSYEKLLNVFWDCHDPTAPNRQGPDVGYQYRSVIFFYTPEQGTAATASKERLQHSGKFKRKIVTQILPAGEFYKAEDYHQQYLEKRGMAACLVH